MAYHDKIQITLIVIAAPDQVAEGDRIFKSHGPWMESTHYRSGRKALLSYNVSRVRSFRTRWIPTLPRPTTRVSS